MTYVTPFLTALFAVAISVYCIRASRARGGWRRRICFALSIAALLCLPAYMYATLGAKWFFESGDRTYFVGMTAMNAISAVQLVLTASAGAFACFGLLRSAQAGRADHP